jgi:hypothetical protein
MSDTVSASVISTSLADDRPTFVLDQQGTGASETDAAIGVYASDFHVSGAAHASPVSGFGSPLLVDFVTWHSPPTPAVVPTTVSGAGVAGSTHPDGVIGLPPDHTTDLWGS